MTMYRQQLRRLKRQAPPSQSQLRRGLGFAIFIAGCLILLGVLH